MALTISQIGDEYWNYHCANPELQRQAFLDRHRQEAAYQVAGLRFECPPNIYHPTEFGSTRFLLRGLNLELSRWGANVLEMGTGSGTVGVWLASTGRNVTMLDTDPVAVECARHNAKLNAVTVDVLQSDLFSAVKGKKYDLIVFNPPLRDKIIEESIELFSCDTGGRLFEDFMAQAKEHLTTDGYVCCLISNIGNRAAIVRSLQQYDHHIVYAEHYPATGEWRWVVCAQPLR